MENALHARDRAGVQDFVLLEDFRSEEAFVDNLRKRFTENLIYTYIGPVLVSVNPYKNLDIYGVDFIEQYRNVNFYELPPHIYAIGDTAYRLMREECHDQCILISGESGSGKTEASKKILLYLAAASHHAATVENVKDKLLLSNPVLEAFGNAKTNRNDNSSRFGKYMDVEFNYLGTPLGGHILNYLLEKSRVVHQNRGERNFHIFYQLVNGADDELLQKLHLRRDPSIYFYLSQGNSTEVSGVDDAEQFKVVKQALSVIDFNSSEEEALFAIVASVLHLGNVGFIEENGQAIIAQEKPVKAICQLLGCPEDTLCDALINKTIEAKGELLTSPLNRDQAIYARDALAKAIYERLFTWLVKKLNTSLQTKTKTRKTLMGLLDIYGFEIFERNSFEQFCINYCNEKLQQLFIELTLKSEQEEYQREGIEWVPVQYFNNKIICDLVEERYKGIVAILDEECLRPGDATDLTFLSKLEDNVGSHAHFLTHRLVDSKTKKTIARDEFRMVHYAGDVTYKVEGFLDKNNDLLYRDLKKAMTESENLIIKQTFSAKELSSKRRPETAATQFKNSLSQLMNILMSKEPWYIRCIKPNDSKRPALFDENIVGHQVKYLGLMENLRVRRAGFAYRRPYEAFLKRYKCLCPATWPHYQGNPKDGVSQLVRHLGYQDDDYRMGKTKLFIRFPRTLFETEDAFQLRKHDLATKIQATFRGYVQRKRYLIMRASVTIIACYWRRYVAIKLLERRRLAAKIIRKFIKGFICRMQPTNEENEFFKWYVKSEFLRRLAKSLPQSVLDNSWPPAPRICQEASGHLKAMHKTWLVRKYCKTIRPERRAQLEQKVLAEELFKERKQSYAPSIPLIFVSNRLSPEQETLRKSVFENNVKQQDEKALYCIQVTKYDRHGYKPRARILVLTNFSIYILDQKDFKLKHRLSLKDITGIHVSNLTDGLMILRIPAELKKDKGDLILDCGQYLVEVIVKIIMLCKKKALVKVEDTGCIAHYLSGGKQGMINFCNGIEPAISRGKNGHLTVISVSPQQTLCA